MRAEQKDNDADFSDTCSLTETERAADTECACYCTPNCAAPNSVPGRENSLSTEYRFPPIIRKAQDDTTQEIVISWWR